MVRLPVPFFSPFLTNTVYVVFSLGVGSCAAGSGPAGHFVSRVQARIGGGMYRFWGKCVDDGEVQPLSCLFP